MPWWYQHNKTISWMSSHGAKFLPLFLASCFAVMSGCALSKEVKASNAIASGKKYLQSKDYRRAILMFRSAAQNVPKNPEPHYEIGLAYIEVGDLNSAVASLRKATELNPHYAEAQLKLAELMVRGQSLDFVREAQERAQAVLADSRDNVDAMATLALSELRLGMAKDAEDLLRQALNKFPRHLKSSILLARV